MTSANITNYTICDLQGNIVGKHSQNAYCKTNWSVLKQFQPYENYTILPWGLDEEENEWYGDIHNLRDFVGYLRVTKNKEI
jgi:hypothetical protein